MEQPTNQPLLELGVIVSCLLESSMSTSNAVPSGTVGTRIIISKAEEVLELGGSCSRLWVWLLVHGAIDKGR